MLLNGVCKAGLRFLIQKTFDIHSAKEGRDTMTVLGKGTKVRTVFLPEDIATEVVESLGVTGLSEENFLFYSKKKDYPMPRLQAFRIVKTSAKQAKVDPLPSQD